MEYYPVNLNIKNRNCLVVGGGQVGSRKVLNLIKCKAIVTVKSITFSEELIKLEKEKKVTLKKDEYKSSDLEDVFLVIGATNNEELNWRISNDAKKLNILCNIADYPAACNFILPSFINRGDLTISISTSGKSPAFAKKLKKELASQYGEEYAELLQLMGAVRKKLLSIEHAPEEHKPLFEQILDGNMLSMIKNKNINEINELLFNILGDGYIYEELVKKT